MPTVVDSLVVELGLDASKFRKGSQDANDAFKKTRESAIKSGKQIEESNKKLGETFSKLTLSALSFLGVLTSAREIKDWIGRVNDASAATGRLADNLGESPQMLQAWGNALRSVGGDQKDAAQSLTNIAKAFYDLRYNGKALPPEVYRVFAMAGQNVDTTHGLDKFLNDTAIALQKIAVHDRTAAFFFGEGLGLSESMVNLMLKYGDATMKFVHAQEGLSATPEQIKAAQELGNEWARTLALTDKIGQNLAGWVDRPLKTMLQELNSILEKMAQGSHVAVENGAIKGATGFVGAYLRFQKWMWGSSKGMGDTKLLDSGGGDTPDSGSSQGGGDNDGTPIKANGRAVGSGNPLPVTLITQDAGGADSPSPSAAPGPGGSGAYGGMNARLISPRGTSPIGNGSIPVGTIGSGRGLAGYQQVYNAAKAAGDPFPEVTAGQWALESNWGRSMSGKNNPFGQMAKANEPGTLRHNAIEGGFSRYKDYASTEDAIADHVRRWSRRYANARSSHEALQILQRNGYATAGNYIPAVEGVIARGESARRRAAEASPSMAGEALHDRPPIHIPSGASLSTMGANYPATTSSSSNQIHIGRLDVNAPQATDATGIAQGISDAMKRYVLASMANYGQA